MGGSGRWLLLGVWWKLKVRIEIRLGLFGFGFVWGVGLFLGRRCVGRCWRCV